ncbi:MAG: hypothetical protein LBG63_02650 [Candidatus Methanoplasma sp.]|jgi:TM2 domain-containing membrane protein YozV|nr:hypothetical protein [Candidatus Methanoplasma sp.]
MGGNGMGNHTHVVYANEKSTGIAALLSILWAGLGQIYVGRIGRGLALMLIHLMVVISSAFVAFAGLLFGGLGGAVGGGFMVFVLLAVLWAWNIFDAYKQANKYNDSLRNSGRRPW